MLSPLEKKTESKKVFLDAINSNNIQLVEDYLHEGTISVDELFMVEDEKMLLCAYKPGMSSIPKKNLDLWGVLSSAV